MKILGVDPGSSRCGYGIIEKNGSQIKLIEAGVIETKTADKNQKLLFLSWDFQEILKKHQPDLISLEKIFFSRNIKTAIEVAQARGILILLTMQKNIPLIEYNPMEVKKKITGYGSADKKMVAKLVSLHLNIADLKIMDDATDAIALAILAAASNNLLN